MPLLVNSAKVTAQCICYCFKWSYPSLSYLPLVAYLWRASWCRKCYYCSQWAILCPWLYHSPGILIKTDTIPMNNMLREAFINLLHEGVSRSLFSVVIWTVMDVNDQNMKLTIWLSGLLKAVLQGEWFSVSINCLFCVKRTDMKEKIDSSIHWNFQFVEEKWKYLLKKQYWRNEW